jgi:hypothetical protein
VDHKYSFKAKYVEAVWKIPRWAELLQLAVPHWGEASHTATESNCEHLLNNDAEVDHNDNSN